MRSDELDFELPAELIAQTPATERAESRLLHYRRDDRSIAHRRFADLPRILRPGDLLVLNDAQVIPARFALRKVSGGRIEALFLDQPQPGRWNVLLKGAGGLCASTVLRFDREPAVLARIIESRGGGEFTIGVDSAEPALTLLARVGRMPLPPYIRRDKDHDDRDELDRQRYQTIYAHEPGAVAAPTAGLHFTQAVLDELDQRGIERAFVTLHVGLGTFRPVTAQALEQHEMHAERYTIPPAAADAINRVREQGRRVVAVGTTAARVLESQPAGEPLRPLSDQTSIFIYPPYRWKHVDALITNFHLPRSTLIAMVAALVSLEEQRRIYAEAIAQRYRFFSYGDAMLVE